jgi:hypothetical protein
MGHVACLPEMKAEEILIKTLYSSDYLGDHTFMLG